MAKKKNSLTAEQARRIGGYLRTLRLRGGKHGEHGRELSQHDLDELSGVAGGFISRLERGEFRQPGESFRRLAAALFTSYEDIISCGTTKGEVYDTRVLEVPFRDEGGFVYVAQKDLNRVDAKGLTAIRVVNHAMPTDNIAIGDILIVDSQAAFKDDALYLVQYQGEWHPYRLRKDGNCYLMANGLTIVKAAQEDIFIAGRFIYCQKGGFSL